MIYPANPTAEDSEVLLIVLKHVLDSMPESQKITIINSLNSAAKKMQNEYVNATTGNKILGVIKKIS